MIILALVVAALICGAIWRRPDARAAAAGAWTAGSAQAAREFRQGYSWAQDRLRRGDPKPYNPRRWASWLLAGAYGAATTIAAANRIRRAAWQGARARYQDWKDAQPVEAEVIEETEVTPNSCAGCGSHNVRWRDQPPLGWYCDRCAHTRDRSDSEQPAPEQPDPGPRSAPDPAGQPTQPEPTRAPDHQEGTTMQNEAQGLTTYAAAHTGLASELRERMSGSESLAASMSGVLSEHSDLIGKTAVLQDILNQAAGVADEIAALSTTVANN